MSVVTAVPYDLTVTSWLSNCASLLFFLVLGGIEAHRILSFLARFLRLLRGLHIYYGYWMQSALCLIANAYQI
jgi:hypothetical protein